MRALLRTVRTVAGIAAAAALAVPGTAGAFELGGAKAIGSAGAFTATSDGADGLQSNPAAAGTNTLELRLGASALKRASVPQGFDPGTVFYGPARLNGFGTFAPLEWLRIGLAMMPIEGTERNTYAGTEPAEFASWSLLPSVSVRPLKFLWIGAGAQLNQTSWNQTTTTDAGLTEADVHATAAGVTVGGLATLVDDRLRVGFGLRGPMTSGFGGVVQGLSTSLPDMGTLKLPLAYEGGVSFDISRQVRVGAQFSHSDNAATAVLLELAGTDAPQHYKYYVMPRRNAVRLGTEVSAAPWLKLRGGISYERSFYIYPSDLYAELRANGAEAPKETAIWGAALGAGFALPLGFFADAGFYWTHPTATDDHYRTGVSVGWAL